ncbi:MAG: TlpA family protein disulfide reductase [Chloroflexi bacterium]|nr:TlpA family protein disulfide reductase [Chloroflexota bacterium]MYD15765.1 TlpA family protein disulfide reductase [Chloroflexota bacterium]
MESSVQRRRERTRGTGHRWAAGAGQLTESGGDVVSDSLLGRLRQRQQSWILFSFLRRPHSVRDAVNRGLIVAAVAAAIVAPIFIGGRGGDAAEGAGEAFATQLAELEDLREQRDSEGDSDELDARIQQLEDATDLGYLERDGDASDKGALAPDFRLLDLEGEPHRLSEIDGPIVLNFWASWCEPCIEEMPEFELVSQEASGRVTFIGINDGESLETAREFAYEVTGVSYLVLLDPTKSMTDGPYPLVGRPTTFFIGADGIIKELRVGIVNLETLRELVGALIGEELGAVEEAMPAEYGDAVRRIVNSAKANFATAEAEIQRWRNDPAVFDDPGWQRNMLAQVMIWADLNEQFAELSPPAQWEDLHGKVGDALAQIANAAGPLVRGAVENGNESELEIAVSLFETFRATFDSAAENLSGVIDTQ